MFYFSCRLAEDIARTKLRSPNFNLGHHAPLFGHHEVRVCKVYSTLSLTEVTIFFDKDIWRFFSLYIYFMCIFLLQCTVHTVQYSTVHCTVYIYIYIYISVPVTYPVYMLNLMPVFIRKF
jgi:hypothetical protein